MLKNNWREKVAAMTETDDVDIEKTFSDIASGFVANKVGDLMKDQHRIGFEVVKKNEDNTRMLGVFAFKVDKELLFAPVFFLSGEIKGPILYRCDTKQFIPANKEWASYLIESIETAEGRGVDRSKLGDTSPMVSLDKIMMRPKQASSNAEKSIKQAFIAEFGEDIEAGLRSALQKSAAFEPGILKEFLSEQGYGLMAMDAIVKAASEDATGNRLVEHIATLYGAPENLINVNTKDFEKKATEVRTLEAHFSFTKQAAEYPKQYFKDGFFMFDKRYASDCCKVTKNPIHNDLISVADAGTYDLVKEDGSLAKDIFCATVLLASECCANKRAEQYYNRPNSKDRLILAIDKEGNTSVYTKVLGIPKLLTTLDSMKDLPGSQEVSEGGVYVAYTKGSDSVSAPFYVYKVNSADGVKFCNIQFVSPDDMNRSKDDGYSTHYLWNHDKKKIIINKDVQSDHTKGIYGKDVKFIKLNAKVERRGEDQMGQPVDIKIKRLDNIAEEEQANAFIFDRFKAPTVELQFDKSASTSPYRIYDAANEERSVAMNKFQVMTKLARDLKIHAKDAYDIVDSAEQNGFCTFMLEGFEKLASRIHIVGRPRFTEEFDSVTGIPVEEAQSFVMDTAGQQEFDERPHMGDAMNPTTATGLPAKTVVDTAPEQLRELADSYNLPNVFEHGAVGTLADTFDANSLLNKYIPKLMEAVDSLGRTKFLLCWKPDDFQKAYGADDMNNLESEIDSTFESLGGLTLKLLKKSDKARKGVAKDDDQLD